MASLCGLLLAAPAFPQSTSDAEQLAGLVRNLQLAKSRPAYAALERFAQENAGQAAGAQAALALGYTDFTTNRHEAALRWLEPAAADPVLREYVLTWQGMALRALGRHAAALEPFEKLRSEAPHSVLLPEATLAMAQSALTLGRAEQVVALLTARGTNLRPEALLARARAYERLGQLARAAQDYNAIYYGSPLAPEANDAGKRLGALRKPLGAEFPAISPAQLTERVAAFLEARRCGDGRSELHRLAAAFSAAERERLLVRVAACHRKGLPSPGALEKLKVADAAADAERLYHMANAYRGKRNESRMLGAVEEAALRYPRAEGTARALFLAGNYFWGRLDHARAALYYQRMVEAAPSSADGLAAHWRLAWQAYLEGSPQSIARAAALISEHLRRYRTTPMTANALYWLGRLAERTAARGDARAYYGKLLQQFPHTYFGQQAMERLREMPAGETAQPEILGQIPAAPPALDLGRALPAAAEQNRRRAEALRLLGLDGYAERELVAAYDATRAPRLLLEAAQAAQNDSRMFAGILLGRRLVPQMDSRRLPDVPEEVWRTVYPLVYGDGIAGTAAQAGLDPMLVAGLIRQESVFQASAVSRAGACGLMQVMPKTGRQLARQLKLRYSRSRLFQPDFNLRLGTTHLKRLVSELGSLEAALAAYNAGESRVAQWTAGRTYSEPAEFVETIPFAETREYVQIVMRNRLIYRHLYGNSQAASVSGSPMSPAR